MGGPASRPERVPGLGLRPLGPRGEGWIGIQVALELAVLVGAPLTSVPTEGLIRLSLVLVGLGLVVAGVALFGIGARELGRSFSVWNVPVDAARLTTSGPYRWVRHPICTAQVVLLAGWSILAASPAGLVGCVVVAAFLDRFKLRVEEAWLRNRYPAYEAYMRAVPHRMLPLPLSRRPDEGRGEIPV